ncbi:MAG: hypothetical protein IKP65_04390 [Alphaproteobacteria bacterium]|nr:hypothetical protein [Alphaproteobacteria bacterium]
MKAQIERMQKAKQGVTLTKEQTQVLTASQAQQKPKKPEQKKPAQLTP